MAHPVFAKYVYYLIGKTCRRKENSNTKRLCKTLNLASLHIITYLHRCRMGENESKDNNVQ